MNFETAFTMDTSSIKYGPGTTREVGYDMEKLGAKRVLVVTDPNLSNSEPVGITLEALRGVGIEAVLYDQAQVEPTDASLLAAIEFASNGDFDGYVAVGGGSSIDTAKAANLYATYPADFLAYVNKPIGEGRPVPGKLKPLIGIPTTAGTGSETTGIIVFDYLAMKVKTGIAHREVRPVLGIIDPNNTLTLPKMAAACTGLDVLCHAVESFTAIPYDLRPAPENPKLRPAYQGANPISDIWTTMAIQMGAENIVPAVHEPEDEEARAQMLLAATYAGVGFGNAGCHLPHAMSYPVSGMVRDYVPEGYPPAAPLIPHGMSVILNAPAVFRFTAQADPERHLYAASLMGTDIGGAVLDDAGDILAQAFIKIMRQIGIPNGLQAVGYTPADVDKLVAGAIPQERLTKLSPRPVEADDLRQLFLDSMVLW